MDDLPFDDLTDFENADQGWQASLVPGVIYADDDPKRKVWDNDQFSFLEGDCPDTADPSLWRQGQLCSRQGLYEVTDGVYQIRGFDLSNMTLIEGDKGVIVVDPLMSVEPAAAGLAFYREHRGDRPVTGLIYTHSHVDHFAGAEGVLRAGNPDKVPILAPEGFMEHAVSENVYAGPAMARRAIYHSGLHLPRDAKGLVSTGLGQTGSSGRVSLIPPNLDITHTGQKETIDGVAFVFQLTPNTEAPAEMHFFLPDREALCVAENATHTLHNILTLRGAVVRDARMWSRYLNEAIDLFAADSKVAFASHHWPTWGTENILAFLTLQRDLYGYLHDQTLRLMNRGHTGIEIAEMMRLPPALENAFHARGYYGSVSHDVKAIYQRYLGWFDGNPAHLWEHPPVEAARRYVKCMGGMSRVLELAAHYADKDDLRFAATLLNHAVFADPAHTKAKHHLAEVYQRLGQGAECGTWRNFYLTGALELRKGVKTSLTFAGGMTDAMTTEQLFDGLAILVDGPKAWSEGFTLDWDFSDSGDKYRMSLSNGVLVHAPRTERTRGTPDLTLTLTRPDLLALLAGKGSEHITMDGDPTVLTRLASVLDQPEPDFPIVTP
ncbi:alkyl/aryl-sulfatase [Actinomadura harenae]|uniref:Linear primary-alkylsulfatase n=1 Tax=Actinomadura harenae TaxID=2483351 RepID=A0A3M2LZI8_9ACTN|nr:alkyl sulfatase dimerization domain-containing protein [Actinomadura harenae]RMI42340.1 MBL fold metallo-hydrolase [Actinomadura harenae]